MRVFHGFDDLPRLSNPVVTVGSYDGVHAGHRKLLDTINGIAGRKSGESVVVTFSPHPRHVLPGGGEVKLLTTLEEKIYLLDSAGVDNLIVSPFTEEFSRLGAEDFIRDYLVEKVGVSTLVVGYNHHFGHNKTGDFRFLERMSDEFGFDIHMIPRQDVDEDKVSSTVIRELIAAGHTEAAGKFLGHPYIVMGGIAEDGSLLPGEPEKLLPPPGIYDVIVYPPEDGFSTSLNIALNGSMSLPELQAFKAGEKYTVAFM